MNEQTTCRDCVHYDIIVDEDVCTLGRFYGVIDIHKKCEDFEAVA